MTTVKLYLRGITISEISLLWLLILFFMGGLNALSIFTLAFMFFWIGIIFTIFMLTVIVRKDVLRDENCELYKIQGFEFEIKNPFILLRNKFRKFNVGDIVDKIGDERESRKRGNIVEIRNFKCRRPYVVTWVDNYTEYYSKDELKLSRIDNWKERIK